MDTQKNCLNETVLLLNTDKRMFPILSSKFLLDSTYVPVEGAINHNTIFERKLKIFSYPSVLPHVLGAQKNRLIEMFWMRNKKITFWVHTVN